MDTLDPEAVDLMFPFVTYLKVDSVWDDLRPDPRFQALVQRLGVPRYYASSNRPVR